MAVTPNTAAYKTGYAATITIGSTSWAKAKVVNLPKQKGGVIKVPHLSGLDVVPDGTQDYGQLVVTVAEDGSANLESTTQITWICVLTAVSKTLTGTGYVTGDDRATAQRGNALERVITVDVDSAPTWS